MSYSVNAGNIRQNCTTELPEPARGTAAAPLTAEEKAAVRARPLPSQGNIWGFLHIMAKTEFELRGKTEEARAAINARVATIKTFGDVQDYHEHVQALLKERKPA
jgi:phospholipase C